MATAKYKAPPLQRAYEYRTGKLVGSTVDLFNPQGGNNPELMRQWHLKWLGDIGTVWNDYTGKGVSVGVYDGGVQKEHWDLASNYDASKHVVIDGKVLDGGPIDSATDASAPHGTAVAGLIAAARNGRGGVGVAYDAQVTGVNIFDPGSPININGNNGAAIFDALRQANQFDVVNHSWGGGSDYSTGNSRSNPASGNAMIAATFEYAATTGRDGLGTVTAMAAGNDALLGLAYLGVTDRHAVAVGAYREADGMRSSYSNFGPHLLVSAPSNDYAIIGGTGQVTTDLLGARGYNFSADPGAAADYTNQFGGTSGATPIVSGVVALMLDANENLGWRDVQNILAASAKMPVAFETGQVAINYNSTAGIAAAGLNRSQFKLAGGDANWNGGAMHYSNDYGYGAVDAYNATRMAEVWSLFHTPATSANEVHVAQDIAVNMTAPSQAVVDTSVTAFDTAVGFLGTPAVKTFTIDSNVALERLDLTLDFVAFQDQFFNDLPNGRQYGGLFASPIRLTAPDGTQVFADITGSQGLPETTDAAQQFTLGFSGLRGVESKGTWTLEFDAYDFRVEIPGFGVISADNQLTINSAKFDMYGSAPTKDDVYTYTNEFFTMAAIQGESGRKALVDADGGDDWINAAAVSSDVTLSLVAGQATSFGGEQAFTIGRNSVIENAVTGDGNDTLVGNRFDNFLVGMRGNDTLNGGNGNDWLIGGTGMDRFLFDNRGTSGKDLVLDFTGGDVIGTQTALRGAGADGRITVAAHTLLLLDGTRTGDTAQLSQQGGAVIQSMGQKDGYFWYAFVSGADIKMGDVIREASFQPTRTAAGAVDALSAASAAFAGDANAGTTGITGATLAGANGDHGAFYLYDAMAGSMSGGVLLHA